MTFKACPFCGEEEAETRVDPNYALSELSTMHPTGGHFVLCLYCEARGPIHATEEKAIGAWNGEYP
jgi:Lar family restriction alleviation protein